MKTLVAKSDFLGLERVAHLAAGGETPFLKSHLDVMRQFAQDKSEGMEGRERFLAIAEETRGSLARMMGCQADDIGFPHSVAQAVNIVVGSLNLKPGDNVVMERWEFPSMFYPWLYYREFGVEVRLIEPDPGSYQAPLEKIAALVDGRTRAVAISQVSYLTGERHDLAAYAKIAHDVGAMLIVDATHALGVVPVHAPHADFLFAACYKWILGTHGVAVAYWNRDRLPNWRPIEVGWRSLEWQNAAERGGDYRHLPTGQIFELGNPAFIGTSILANAVDYLAAVGIDRIESHVLELSGELWRRLDALGVNLFTPSNAEQRAGNIAFAVDDELHWRHELEAREVLTWTSDNRVRMSTHLYNDMDDVARGARAVEEILAQGPRTAPLREASAVGH